MPSYFESIPKITYKGPETDDPFAYRYYDADRIVMGKSMRDHLRFASCYWHNFCWDGVDVFGSGTFSRPWLAGPMDRDSAAKKMRAAFNFFEKIDLPFFCFHDVDVMAAAESLDEHKAYFAHAVDGLEEGMAHTGVKVLWGTANLFSHPRYAAGAATNPDPDVFAFAAAQVRQCLEATQRLKGENYVLWGGREGYETLLNTDLKRELDQLGRFLSLAVEHKHKIGFKGPLLIEPKPQEPTKHQYDYDVSTVYGFLLRYGLEKDVKVNIEANHATLAGHSFEHEVATAIALGIFGSIDANRGDPQNGWDTDQFPNDSQELALVLRRILLAGGFETGGFNFDAKLRRQSIDPEDIFYGHIGGVDQLAKALLIAAGMIEAGDLEAFVAKRYARWDGARGRAIMDPAASLAGIADKAVADDVRPRPVSGRQEYLENLISRRL